MKNTILIVAAAVTGLVIVACSKPNVAVAPPLDNAPVAAAPKAKQAPPQQQAKAAPPAETKQAPAAPKPAAPKKLNPQQRAELNSLLSQLEDALFDYDKSTIRPDASTVLRENVNVIRSILADYPAERLLIEGHADERGSTEYNIALGDRRAAEVLRFLSEIGGIPGSQLQIISYGEERPVCTDTEEGCWQRNRRAHITVAP